MSDLRRDTTMSEGAKWRTTDWRWLGEAAVGLVVAEGRSQEGRRTFEGDCTVARHELADLEERALLEETGRGWRRLACATGKPAKEPGRQRRRATRTRRTVGVMEPWGIGGRGGRVGAGHGVAGRRRRRGMGKRGGGRAACGCRWRGIAVVLDAVL